MAALGNIAENNALIADGAANTTRARRRFPHENEISINVNVPDQYSIFGNFVAARLRNMDERFFHPIKYQIEQLLLEVERTNPNNFYPLSNGNSFRNNLYMYSTSGMPVYTPPANQSPMFPFYSNPYVPNSQFFYPFNNQPMVNTTIYNPPLTNRHDRLNSVPPSAYSPQFPNMFESPAFPLPNGEGYYQQPTQQYFNFNVSPGNRGRPKRNGFNPHRNFNSQRHQQQNNNFQAAPHIRNPIFPDNSTEESPSTSH